MPSRPCSPRAGFADLIERVKPAVISVRVKIEQDDQTVGQGGGMQQQQFGDNERMQRFFRQFGMPDMPNMRQGTPQAVHHRPGLGLLHLG